MSAREYSLLAEALPSENADKERIIHPAGNAQGRELLRIETTSDSKREPDDLVPISSPWRAQSIRQTNDRRAALKSQINTERKATQLTEIAYEYELRTSVRWHAECSRSAPREGPQTFGNMGSFRER
jgi:hypothetical protein